MTHSPEEPLLLSFEDACFIAEALDVTFTQTGTFHVADYGHMDELFAHVIIGAREWLVDHDLDFDYLDDEVVLVNRVTGEISLTADTLVGEYLDEMPRVGNWPDA